MAKKKAPIKKKSAPKKKAAPKKEAVKQVSMQALFIEKLKEMIPAGVSIADELADVLGVSVDSVYRRLRCETDITLNELDKISTKYGISIDSVFANRGDNATFQYISLTENAFNFEKYLNNIAMHLQRVNSFERKQIIYAAEEIPMFHSFHSPELAAFKMFYWERSVLNIAELQAKKFDFDLLDEKLLKLGKHINTLYSTIPSIEIWTDETILTAIKQLEFYVESGVFKNKEDALIIADSISNLMEDLQIEAQNSHKRGFEDVSYKLYKSDVVIGTNCIHVDIDDRNYSFISFNSINSLSTTNSTFCKETEEWMRNLIRKSSLISGTAEKQRYQFFNKMKRDIERSKEKINNAF